jgi:hypothetical protein
MEADAMDAASVRGRRVAYGSEDFSKPTHQSRIQGTVSAAKILQQSKSDKPVNLQAIVSQRLLLSEGERKAVVQVASAVPQPPLSIKSQINALQKIKLALSDLFGVDNDKSREATVASIFRKLKSHFGDSVPNFQSVWENRKNNNQDYRLLVEFGRVTSQTESIEFLRAVDDFRSAPSVDKANKILKVFIEPDPVDDSGIPIADPSKMQINLQSETVRKELLSKVGGCINRAKSGDPGALNAVLGELLPVETYLVKMIKLNVDTVYRASITNQARQTPANSISGTGTGGFA